MYIFHCKYQVKLDSSPFLQLLVLLPNLHMLTTVHHFPETWLSGLLGNCFSVLDKCKSTIPLLFNCPEVLSSATDKVKLFDKNFFNNSNFENSGIPLPDFPSRTNLKLHNIYVIPKMVNKVIMNLNSSRASSPEFIPVMVLKNCI